MFSGEFVTHTKSLSKSALYLLKTRACKPSRLQIMKVILWDRTYHKNQRTKNKKKIKTGFNTKELKPITSLNLIDYNKAHGQNKLE